MFNVDAGEGIQLLFSKVYARYRTAARGHMRPHTAEVDDLSHPSCADGRGQVFAHLVDILFPVRRRVMGRHHGINGVRTSKTGGQKREVLDLSYDRPGAGSGYRCASFRVTADNAYIVACPDQPADQRPGDIAQGSKKYIIHDCKFDNKAIPSLRFYIVLTLK